MWIYQQATGRIIDEDTGEAVGIGYSGFRDGKNNPSFQEVHNVGPIPCGLYTIQAPRDTHSHGPFVLPLIPDAENEMHGRDGFLIHGDSVRFPGTASLGCIIMSRDVRERIWKTGDRRLKVVSGLDEPLSAWT
jgi:hypothetical protein